MIEIIGLFAAIFLVIALDIPLCVLCLILTFAKIDERKQKEQNIYDVSDMD